MNAQKQIQLDIALISENDSMQSQLLSYLKELKGKMQSPRNTERVLAHAGRIDNKAAQEVTQIINTEFGKIDSNWE